jgi:mono/diheme cytochrome c family protein
MIEKYVDQEELRRLLAHLAAILTLLMIGGLFATIVVPGLRNANKPETQTPVSPAVGEPGWLNPAEYPPERGKLIPPVDPQTLIKVSPELLARGKELFSANCVQCHGELGHGDGPGGANLNPPPRNFASPNGWTNGYDLPSMYKTLSEGVKGTSMAAFDYLSKKDRMSVLHYVQSLGAFPHGTGNPQALAALTKELGSAGEKTPNKIPVSMAMAKLVSECQSPAPFTIAANDSSQEAQILRRMIVDTDRAATTLSGSNLWRSGLNELAATLIPDAEANGFSTDVATLNSSEWKTLQEAILKKFEGEARQRVTM